MSSPLPIAAPSEIHGQRFFKRAFVYGRYKLIDDVRHRGRLRFDLEEDPAEATNIWYGQATIRQTVF